MLKKIIGILFILIIILGGFFYFWNDKNSTLKNNGNKVEEDISIYGTWEMYIYGANGEKFKGKKVGELHIKPDFYEVKNLDENTSVFENFENSKTGTVKFDKNEIESNNVEVVLGKIYFNDDFGYQIRKSKETGSLYFHSLVSEISLWGIVKNNN